MINFPKIVCILSIYWSFSNCIALVGGVDDVENNTEQCQLKMPELAEQYGYDVDTESVITEDGYILTVYCVYNTSALNSFLNPVIAWHGLMDASHTFVLNYPDQSLALLLADRGYYVCLPNSRGNGFSQGYVNGSKNSAFPLNPYWRFSWDQIAEFDVPAVIDAVLEWTGKLEVIYIGHSQGSTTLFALLSSDPSYNAKISTFVALAPVVFFKHTTSPLYTASSNIEFLLRLFYGAQFVPHTDLQTLLQLAVCTLPTEELCKNLVFFLFGYSEHIDESRLPAFLCHSPSDFAWGQYLQYVQHVKVNKFQKYDFKSLNLIKYGQGTPPQYNLSNVSVPVALFWSEADSLTQPLDVEKLKMELGNNVFFEQRLPASENFNHVDYVWAKDAFEMVYSVVMNKI